MVFLILMTTGSMILNFKEFAYNPLLLVLSAIILALAVWLIPEAAFVYNRQRNSEVIIAKVPEIDEKKSYSYSNIVLFETRILASVVAAIMPS